MSAFMGILTFVSCTECDDVYKEFDRWGEAEMYMDDHNKKVHGE